MMARWAFERVILGLIASGLALVTSGCGGGNDQKLRYKIIIEADTPSGIKTGFSVIETDMNKMGFTYGQAPYVDLGNGRYVFALLDNQFGTKPMYQIALDVLRYPELQPRLNTEKHLFVQAKHSNPTGVVRREDYPMLVTFDDINDPKTVREVDPGSVQRITFQVVDQDEPLTVGLEEKLLWLQSDKDGPLERQLPGAKLEYTDEAPLKRKLKKYSFVWRKK